jgi:hypothetical protein
MEFDEEKTAVIDHLNYDVSDQGKVSLWNLSSFTQLFKFYLAFTAKASFVKTAHYWQ